MKALRQTIAEKKAAGEHLDSVALEITDQSGRILAVIDFVDDPPPGSVNPTRQ